ncbi:hypothetical protein T492DRAFT_1116952 [Pavlovales sp. CCMP2436]|nr:hypothetical protein T492DRAFT_1116952 [Pavlovales sp. CCMP2436]
MGMKPGGAIGSGGGSTSVPSRRCDETCTGSGAHEEARPGAASMADHGGCGECIQGAGDGGAHVCSLFEKSVDLLKQLADFEAGKKLMYVLVSPLPPSRPLTKADYDPTRGPPPTAVTFDSVKVDEEERSRLVAHPDSAPPRLRAPCPRRLRRADTELEDCIGLCKTLHKGLAEGGRAAGEAVKKLARGEHNLFLPGNRYWHVIRLLLDTSALDMLECLFWLGKHLEEANELGVPMDLLASYSRTSHHVNTQEDVMRVAALLTDAPHPYGMARNEAQSLVFFFTQLLRKANQQLLPRRGLQL